MILVLTSNSELSDEIFILKACISALVQTELLSEPSGVFQPALVMQKGESWGLKENVTGSNG